MCCHADPSGTVHGSDMTLPNWNFIWTMDDDWCVCFSVAEVNWFNQYTHGFRKGEVPIFVSRTLWHVFHVPRSTLVFSYYFLKKHRRQLKKRIYVQIENEREKNQNAASHWLALSVPVRISEIRCWRLTADCDEARQEVRQYMCRIRTRSTDEWFQNTANISTSFTQWEGIAHLERRTRHRTRSQKSHLLTQTRSFSAATWLWMNLLI